jgi:hypothetical protein
MAEEERVTEIRELAAHLTATQLEGGFVPEEGREFLARHPSFHGEIQRRFLIVEARTYGSLKFEGVLHIVVRSRYERDLDYPQ